MKILLVQCPCSFGVEMPSLGLAYLYSALKKAERDVAVVDLSIELYKKVNAEYKHYWQSNNGYHWYLDDHYLKMPFIHEEIYQWCVDRIGTFLPDVIGFSVQNTSVAFTMEIARRIKQRDPAMKIVFGGPNCYNLSNDDNNFVLSRGLQEFADLVVVGEGERTFVDVCDRIEKGRSFDGCAGVAFPVNGRWVFNGFASAILNLDELSFPDFDAYDLSAYANHRAFPMITSRGCVMKCVFCTDTQFWSPYRFRSADNIIAEMVLLKEKYQNNFIGFNDSLINGNLANLFRLCNLMIEKRLEIGWGGNFRVDKRVDLGFLRKMKASGCDYFILGLESASDRVLGLMRKGFTIGEAKDFLIKCKQAGINIVANWIVGFPGERDEDFMATANFIRENRALIKTNTFSSLTVNQFSFLSNHKEDFGVVLNGHHLGLWVSKDGVNTIEVRTKRLQYLENLDKDEQQNYSIVRQV